MTALQFILSVLSVFTALGLACAIGASRPRCEPGIGRRRGSAADPLSHPFGDAPHLCRDLRRRYSREQLEEIARR